MKVADILKVKGSYVFSVTSDTTVYDALLAMKEKNIGAVIVMDGGELKGILSERDYARKIILMGKSSQETLVKEIMTENVFTVDASDTLETCMGLMSDKHIRHLPVVQNGIVTAMVSVSDVVKAIINAQRETIDHLKNYISQ
ncbi:MAG: CBS domain-containing protein [Ferruginibacter sp.]